MVEICLNDWDVSFPRYIQTKHKFEAGTAPSGDVQHNFTGSMLNLIVSYRATEFMIEQSRTSD